MYKINEELKSKLHIEYYLHPKTNGDFFGLLNEEHGINTHIMSFCDTHTDDFINEINNHIKNMDGKFVYQLFGEEYMFFQKLYIRAEIVYGKKYYLSASYIGNRTYVNKEDRKFGEITIRMSICVPDQNFDIKSKTNEIIGMIAHELNHAFEDYNRRFSGKENMFTQADRNGYSKNTAMYNPDEDIDKRVLSFILYHLYNCEVNSYITELIQEIRPKLADCDTSQKAWKVVCDSLIWKKYMNVEKYIERLLGTTDESTREMLLQYYNEIRKTPVSSYDTMIKILKKQWIKIRKQLVNRVSKQITDIALKNSHWNYPFTNTTATGVFEED